MQLIIITVYMTSSSVILLIYKHVMYYTIYIYYYYEMNIVQKYTKTLKNNNTPTINTLGLIGTHQLYHKINVFAVKTL